jgi:cytoskeletal protein CcmA (bactofilin family)
MNTTGTATKNVLNAEVEIKGNLKFAGELTLEGKLEGEIQSEGTLLLGDSAVVNGNINVGTVVVRGKINGNITARDKIDIKARTELFGDIRAAKLVIEEGVTFVGKSEVNPNKASPGAAAKPSSASTPAPEAPKTEQFKVLAGGR